MGSHFQGYKQDHDSAERYDADGDLSVPINAQGQPYQFNSSKIELEADRKRKNVYLCPITFFQVVFCYFLVFSLCLMY